MRALALPMLLTLASAIPALAQPSVLTPSNGAPDNSVIAVPPAPPIVAAPSAPLAPENPATPAPPGLSPTIPPDTGNADTGAPQNGNADATAQPAAPASPGATVGTQDQSQDQDVIPTPPNTWQPATVAKIGVLDKIDGEVTEISVPVGGQSVVGDLQVNVLACVLRPADQVPDAAVFLSLQNTGDLSGPPDYRGWLVRSAPGAAVAGDASETFRIIDCS